MVALSYIFFLGFIPLLTKKDDKEVQWHAKNGLVLFFVYFIVRIVWWAIVRFLIGSTGGFGCLAAPILIGISCILWLGYIALMILCIVKGVNGERFRLPVVTDFAEKL